MARVLVAGASGYLGRHAVTAFKRHGWTTRALVRDPARLGAARADADEIVTAEVTRDGAVDGCCEGVDVVFSSLGITRQADGVTYEDVDYRANRRVLDEALRAKVGAFEFVSVLHPEVVRHLEMVAARERLVDELKASPIRAIVIRPSGFFSDMGDLFQMAQNGRAYVIGAGTAKISPIHGEDLAEACVAALAGTADSVDVGGPETFTYQQIAELAFEVLGKPPHVTHVPSPLTDVALPIVRLFSRRYWNIAAFLTTVGTHDMVGPPHGRHTLREFFEGLAAAAKRG